MDQQQSGAQSSNSQQTGSAAGGSDQANVGTAQIPIPAAPQSAPINSKNRVPHFLQRLTINEFLTLVVAAVACAASVQSCRVTADNSDTLNAIGQLTNLTAATAREADSIGNEVDSVRTEAQATRDLVPLAGKSAGAAIASVRPQADNFALDERPIISLAQTPIGTDAFPEYVPAYKQWMWNYTTKNYGKTTAFKISSIEGLSVNGKPFFEVRRVETEQVPTDSSWSTAFYPDDTAPTAKYTPVIMRVHIVYFDAANRRYEKYACLANRPQPGVFGECIYADTLKIGVDPRSPTLSRKAVAISESASITLRTPHTGERHRRR